MLGVVLGVEVGSLCFVGVIDKERVKGYGGWWKYKSFFLRIGNNFIFLNSGFFFCLEELSLFFFVMLFR